MRSQLILTALVSVAVAVAATWWFMRFGGGAATTDPRTLFATEKTEMLPAEEPENLDEEVLRMLTDVGWHPDEVGRPSSVNVVTDDEIAADEFGDFEVLLEEGITLLDDPAVGEPRHRFALGRIAFMLGSPDRAKEFFNKAIEKKPDLLPAKGYLVLCEPKENTQQEWDQYKEAEALGFTAARKWREELEKEITQEIDRLTADPFDLKKPTDVVGISEERLLKFHPKEIKAMIDGYQFYALAPGVEPRLAFGLGRAAYLHGLHDKAGVKALLSHAANQGYAAAHAYLGRAELADSIDEQIEHLRKAVQGGYEPADWWLKKAERIKSGLDAAR